MRAPLLKILLAALLAVSPAGARADANCFIGKLRQLWVLSHNDFNTGRRFEEYVHEFGSDFAATIAALRSDSHWVDAGAGEGGAIGEYAGVLSLSPMRSARAMENPDAKLEQVYDPRRGRITRLPSPQERAKVTGIAFAIPGSAKKGIARMSAEAPNRFRYLSGRYLEDIPASEIHPADLITDFFGPLAYSTRVDEVLNKYIEVLKKGGNLFAIHLGGETLVKTPHGPLDLETWIRRFSGSEIQAKLTDNGVLQITKLTDRPFHFPKLRLVQIKPGSPPIRSFEEVAH